MRKIDFEEDPLKSKSPRKSIASYGGSPKRASVLSPKNKRGSSIQVDLTNKMKDFDKKSLLPYTEERDLLILPSIYAVQFEKSGIHERSFSMALFKEKEIKNTYLSKF